MTRRICLLFLLAQVSLAFAQPLYKWVEDDGSITFSPVKPSDGTTYETITPKKPVARISASKNAARTDLPTRSKTPQAATKGIVAADGTVRNKAGGNQNDSARPTGIDSMVNRQNLPPGISQSTGNTPLNPITSGVAIIDTQVRSDKTGIQEQSGMNKNISATEYKMSRCEDLKKRVTSLEGRLRSRLTPEDMDNTVIYMARYQRSYDQNCEQ